MLTMKMMVLVVVVVEVAMVMFMAIIYHPMNVTKTEFYSETTINAIALVQDDCAAFKALTL